MSEIDWDSAGKRIALLRARKGYSIRHLAARADVDKNTILRLERGLKIRMASFHRICLGLDTSMGRQLLGMASPGERYALSRHSDRQWVKPVFRTRHSDSVVGERNLDIASERWKVGWAGGEPAFNGLIDADLFDGAMVSSVLELFSGLPPQSHSGEEFVYCIRGAVIVSIDSEKIKLNEHDAVCFLASRPHSFAPAYQVGVGSPPPLILSVRCET